MNSNRTECLDPKLKSVLDMAMSVLPEEIGCDDAFEYFAAYAERALSGTPIPGRFQAVTDHLGRCPSCQEELDRLLKALKSEASPG